MFFFSRFQGVLVVNLIRVLCFFGDWTLVIAQVAMFLDLAVKVVRKLVFAARQSRWSLC